MDKIDPKLKGLIAAHAAGEPPSNRDSPQHLVHVYVTAANGDFSGLKTAGYDLLSELAGSAIVILPIGEIETLAARDDVVGVFASPVGRPLADEVYTVDQKAVRLTQAYQVKSTARPNGTRGAGVVVGIVDSGVNVMHDAFRTAAPDRKTRILFYWAQDDTIRPGAGPLWDRMGKVFTAAAIDALIAAHPSGHGIPEGLMDVTGHGTTVASVASGSEWPKDPPATKVSTGVAPDAHLIVVGGQKDKQAGIEFCFAKADVLAKPCVVNMSLGRHEGAHNGRSLFDDRIKSLLTAKAGRVFVQAAGNDGRDHVHARAAIPHPGSLTLDISVGPEEFWLSFLVSGTKRGGVKATVAPPLRRRGAARTFFQNGEVHREDGRDRHKVSIVDANLATDPDWHVVLLVESAADEAVKSNAYVRAGTWQLKLEPLVEAQPVVDVWLTNANSHKIRPLPGSTPAKEEALETDAQWRRPRNWIEHTLSSEACGRDAIVVGVASVSRESSTFVSPDRRSSRGPSTDASIPVDKQKPDLVAPGVDVLVAKWTKPKTAAGRGISGSIVVGGSSVAAPFVTGAVALLLSHFPTLKHSDVLDLLRILAAPGPLVDNAQVFAWMSKYHLGDRTIIGQGLLDIEGLLKGSLP